jgi:hypothetical protein
VNYRNYRSQTLAYLTTSNLKENCDINISDGFKMDLDGIVIPVSDHHPQFTIFTQIGLASQKCIFGFVL